MEISKTEKIRRKAWQVVAVILLIVAIGFAIDAVFFPVLERNLQREWT